MAFLSNLFPARMRVWLLPALCVLVVAALAAVFVWEVPVSRLLLWALVLACPLSHLLMGHGGHGGHDAHATQSTGGEGAPAIPGNSWVSSRQSIEEHSGHAAHVGPALEEPRRM